MALKFKFNALTGQFDLVDVTNTSGFVTSVTASAPLSSSGGTTPNLTITQAGAASNGFLSSIDWNTFNNKQSAGNYITALTGDVSASGPGSATATLATVNSNVGSFGTASQVGTFTVNAKGLITAASNTSIQIAESQVTNLESDLAGKVTSVSGTLNRITSTGGTTPVIDISASYVGQASITTLGTITTGVWNGTAIANANLANSSITIGSTNIALGATSTTLAGLTSVASTSFTGALTGNASTATALATGRTISITGDLAYTSPSFDGSGNVTAAGTLATVNTDVGTFGSATQAPQITVNGKGLVTAVSNVTVTPAVGSITGLGTGVATFLATPSSANLLAAVTDETGTGALVFGTSPTFTTQITTPLISGSSASGGNLTLQSTSHATKGQIILASGGTSSGVDVQNTFFEERGNWVIGSNSPTMPSLGTFIHIAGSATQDRFMGMGLDPGSASALTFGYSGFSFGRGSAFFNTRPDASAVAPNPSIRFLTANTLAFMATNAQNLKIAGTALRATTEGTNHLDIFNGTAPVGTLANGISLYSTAGELRVMDAAGNPTLLSPHDKNNNWIFDSYVGKGKEKKRLIVDMEKMVRFLNKHFGADWVHEYEIA